VNDAMQLVKSSALTTEVGVGSVFSDDFGELADSSAVVDEP
jgi:hypothetical protein